MCTDTKNKKTVIVTGASRGIGKRTAELFAQDGYNTVINYNSSEKDALTLTEELCKQGLSAVAIRADVSVPEEAKLLIQATAKKFGTVDVLINNAGISYTGLLTDMNIDMWHKVFAVNTDAVFNCTAAVLPYMVHRKSGAVINISSIWGLVGASCEVAYSASKAAVLGFTKALAKEVGPSGITVNCIAPGVIDTDMNKNLSACELSALCEETPLGKIGTPDNIAQSVLFLASEKARFITGQIISPNGGFVIN